MVPFGLKTSTAALVRGLDHVLRGIGDHVISFVDDTLITPESTKQHLKHLEELLKRLEINNLTFNLSKSNFFKKETKFLGFIPTTKGIKPDPEKNCMGITKISNISARRTHNKPYTSHGPHFPTNVKI